MEGKNYAHISGLLEKAPVFHHSSQGIKFYHGILLSPRLSGQLDSIPIIFPENFLGTVIMEEHSPLEILGQVRSFNEHRGTASALKLSIFPREMRNLEGVYRNELTLFGSVCKAPVLRKTPLGRDICDVLLAVNRRYHKGDYLPCIAWGSLALHCAGLGVGDTLHFSGRLQSRVYQKKLGDVVEERRALEVSMMSLLPLNWV